MTFRTMLGMLAVLAAAACGGPQPDRSGGKAAPSAAQSDPASVTIEDVRACAVDPPTHKKPRIWDPYAGCVAVRAFSERRGALGEAVALLNSGDPLIRGGALAVLTELGGRGSASIAGVLPLLQDGSDLVAVQAAKATVTIAPEDETVRKELSAALRGQRGSSAQRAVLVALELKPSQGLPYEQDLVVLLNAADALPSERTEWGIAVQAARVIRGMGPLAPSAAAVLRRLHRTTESAGFGAALATVSPEEFRDLMAGELKSRDLRRIGVAMEALEGQAKSVFESVLPDILALGRDSSPLLRLASIAVIGRGPLDEGQRAEYMFGFLNDVDKDVRRLALEEIPRYVRAPAARDALWNRLQVGERGSLQAEAVEARAKLSAMKQD